MMRIPHELPEEFPQDAKFIERWIKTDYEFGRLAARYDELNREIYQIELGRADNRRGARKAQEAASQAQG